MAERYKDPDMQEVIRRTIRAAMAEENVSYQALSSLLKDQGVAQNESTLRTKVSTGLMTTSLFIHILSALSIDNLAVDQLFARYLSLKAKPHDLGPVDTN